MRNAVPLFPDHLASAAPGTCFMTTLEGGFLVDDEEGRSTWRTLTVCLDFTNSSEDNAVLHQVGSGVRHSRLFRKSISGERVPQLVADALLSAQADQVGVVLVLPDTQDASCQAAAVIDRLRATLGQVLGAILAVSSYPEAWADLAGINGHVRGRAGGLWAEARAVFDLLSVCAAPSLLGCVDLDDICTGFQASAEPLEVVQAVWLHDRGELRFHRNADDQQVSNARALLLAPFWTDARISDVTKLRAAVLGRASPEVEVVNAMSLGHFVGRQLAANAFPVVVMCGR